MKKKFMVSSVLLMIILISILTMGCTLRSPEDNPTYSLIPGVLLDYDFDTQMVRIWVKSAISDFKYDNIEIELISDNTTVKNEDNNTYCLYSQIKAQRLNMTVQIIRENKLFQFSALVEIIYEDNENPFQILITDPETDEQEIILEEDLPYKKVIKDYEEI
jgi:hypothetical protein